VSSALRSPSFGGVVITAGKMLSFAVRSTSALTPALSATNQVVASKLKPLIPAFVQKGQQVFVQTPAEGKTSDALFALLPKGGCMNVAARSTVVSSMYTKPNFF